MLSASLFFVDVGFAFLLTTMASKWDTMDDEDIDNKPSTSNGIAHKTSKKKKPPTKATKASIVRQIEVTKKKGAPRILRVKDYTMIPDMEDGIAFYKRTNGAKRFRGKIGSGFRLGTDCSGIEAPVMALEDKAISHTHVFSSDTSLACQKVIMSCYSPTIVYPDVKKRDNTLAPAVDAYVFGSPCQSYSRSGKSDGDDDSRAGSFTIA